MKKYPYILLFSFFCLLFSFSCYAQQGQNKERMNYELAKQYMDEEKYSQAIPLLEDIVDRNLREEYYRLINDAYTRKGDTKKQEKLIKKAVKQNKDNRKYAIDLGTFYINNYNKIKGEKEYNNVLKNLTANNSEIIQTANYFSAQRLYEWAAKVYMQGRKTFNDETKYTYELTYFYQLLGMNDKIADEYLLLLDNNPNMLSQIEVNINNLFNRDKDDKLFEIFAERVLEQVKKHPQKKEINLLYYWLMMKENDYESALIQAKAIDKRFNKSDGSQVYDFALTAMNNTQYKYALQGFDYLIKQDNDTMYRHQILQNRLTCLYRQFTEKLHHTEKETNNLLKEYEQVFSKTGYTPQSAVVMQQYANLLAYHLQRPQQAVDVLDSIINMRQVSGLVKAECKLTRADIYLINGDIWQASLTYSQVDKDFKNEVIGSEAKFRNARLSYFNGDFEWAESQADALRSSTTKLIANDAMELSLLIKENIDQDSSYKGLSWFSKADFLLYQNKTEEAVLYLDSIENWFVSHPLFDEVLYKKAQIAIKENNYHKADSLLREIILKYPYDLTADDALMLLAQINEEQFGNPAKAKEYYEKIIIDYPSSLYISQARKKYKDL